MDENNMNNAPENVTADPVEEHAAVSEEQAQPDNMEIQNVEPNAVSNPEQIPQAPQANGSQPGKGAAVASLVLGIVSVVCWSLGAAALIGLVTGIVGLVCSSNAKKQGFTGGIQVAGFVCSLVGLVGCALIFVACMACFSAANTTSRELNDIYDILNSL